MNQNADIPVWLQKLPNQLTFARVAVAPVVLLLYPLDIKFFTVTCGFLCVFAAATDYFDGLLARQYGLVTKLGATLDPIADKVLSATGLILLAGMDRLPILLAGLILCRDIAISGIRELAAKEKILLDVNYFGKWKTVFQSVGICLLLLHYPLFGLPLRTLGMISVWIALLFSYYSAYVYILTYWQAINQNDDDDDDDQ